MTYQVRHAVPGSELTTLQTGGPCARVVETHTEDELIAALSDFPEALCIGGGSNLVISDEGFGGTIIRAACGSGGVVNDASDGTVHVEAAVEWDRLVKETIEADLQGLEATSGVPGTIGGGIVQNAGAYGQEIGDLVLTVTAWDRKFERLVTLSREDCGFLYRNSRFKHDETRRYVITSTDLQLARSANAQPRYGEVSQLLAKQEGHDGPYPLELIRSTVLEVRTSKGMIVGTSDPSAGSFFTNPALDDEQAAALDSAGFTVTHRSDGVTLTSAAALIEAAGFVRGYEHNRAGLSEHHVLALVNRGGATTTDILELAAMVQDAVNDRFSIWLHPEPVMLGFAESPLSPH